MVDCFSGDYLTILLRELNSALPKPNKLSDFIAIAKNTLDSLEKIGITNTEMLYDLGVDSVEKVSESDPIDLHAKINKMIKEKNIFKGAIGLNDVKILIESASELPLEIEN